MDELRRGLSSKFKIVDVNVSSVLLVRAHTKFAYDLAPSLGDSQNPKILCFVCAPPLTYVAVSTGRILSI